MFAVTNLNSQLVYAPYSIEIIVPIEYDNNSSQIPIAKCLFNCKTKRNSCLFYAHCICDKRFAKEINNGDLPRSQGTSGRQFKQLPVRQLRLLSPFKLCHSLGNRQQVHSAVQCDALCLCRFMQFTGCDQPVQHSHWLENAIDWLP